MRVLALLLALVAWFCSAFVMLAALAWGLGLKCDDSCGPSRGWRGDPDAWQWNGLAALGVVAFLAAGVLFASVWVRRPLVGAVAVVVGFSAVYVFVGGLSSDWVEHLDRRSGGELLLIVSGVFAPIFAVLLTVPEVVGRRER